MVMNAFKDLYIDQLKDLYSAESQLVKALPKMVAGASHPALREAFSGHLEQTKGHVNRLEQVLERLGEKPTGKKCQAMQGLIEEGKEILKGNFTPAAQDAGLIAAAQKVEHYEMAGYGTVRTYARQLGEGEAAELLEATLKEEGAADHKLNELALQSINVEAAASPPR